MTAMSWFLAFLTNLQGNRYDINVAVFGYCWKTPRKRYDFAVMLLPKAQVGKEVRLSS
jgi:hypothetical protein